MNKRNDEIESAIEPSTEHTDDLTKRDILNSVTKKSNNRKEHIEAGIDEGERSHSNLDRRSFVGSIGLSVGVLPFTTSNREEEIQYTKYYKHTNHEAVNKGEEHPERREVTDRMSVDTWEITNISEAGINNVINQLQNEFVKDKLVDTHTVFKGADYIEDIELQAVYTTTEDGESKPEITFDEFKNAVPNTVTGRANPPERSPVINENINVKVTKERESKSDCDGNHFNSGHGSDIPGGVQYETADGRTTCTIATPAIHDNSLEKRFLTAGHCVNDKEYMDEPDIWSGRDGDISYWINDGAKDVGSIAPYDGEHYDYSFADDSGGSQYAIVGTLSWQEIKNRNQNNADMGKRGRTTGIEVGTMESVGKDNSNDMRWFTHSANDQGGDSGGPNYIIDTDPSPNEVYISGVTIGHRGTCSGTCNGLCAYTGYIGDAEDAMNVTV